MGNACAKGENRSEVDNMEPSIKTIPGGSGSHIQSPPSSQYTDTHGHNTEGYNSAKTSILSSFEISNNGDLVNKSVDHSTSSLNIEDF